MEESDTYLMILEQGQEKQAKEDVLHVGEKRLGPAGEPTKTQLEGITDLGRLNRMLLQAVTAATWGEILDTP